MIYYYFSIIYLIFTIFYSFSAFKSDINCSNSVDIRGNQLILSPILDVMYLDNLKKTDRLIDENPFELLLAHAHAKGEYNKLVSAPFIDITYLPSIQNYIEEQTHIIPLWLLDECRHKECNLSRTNNNARLYFEGDVVKAILKRAQSKLATLNYVNLGAGELFQDLLILDKALKKGLHSVRVFLIDPLYADYLEVLNNRKITENFCLDNTPSMISFYSLNELFRQFLSWFNIMHPQACIEVFIYKSLDDYINHTLKDRTLTADIYIASDLSSEAREDYESSFYDLFVHQEGIGLRLRMKIDDTKRYCSCEMTMPFNYKPPYDFLGDIILPTTIRDRYRILIPYYYLDSTNANHSFTNIHNQECQDLTKSQILGQETKHDVFKDWKSVSISLDKGFKKQ